MSIPTPHIEAQKDQIAKVVVMSGDPLRAKKWVDKHLVNTELVNEVRGMLAYTGQTKSGKKVTVMGHGMGLDSIGIYAYELYKFYEVETIIRFGSCGVYSPELNLFDLIIAEEAYTESNFGDAYGYEGIDTIPATKELVNIAIEAAKEVDSRENKLHIGKIHSSMWFYKEVNVHSPEYFVKKDLLGAEMEAYALYAIAKALNKKALTILSVSDNIATHESTTAKQRQTKFSWMFNVLDKILEKIL